MYETLINFRGIYRVYELVTRKSLQELKYSLCILVKLSLLNYVFSYTGITEVAIVKIVNNTELSQIEWARLRIWEDNNTCRTSLYCRNSRTLNALCA
jgi:hypothetical protein